ncbi:histone-lysine N-methyltransferase SETMAR [Trichonephila clavipes]|nr:histone-lysine N-methyltransferase SETMAR [Trichonephila clavipes]
MQQGTTINAAAYCATLTKLRRAIQNKRRGLLTSVVLLLHDNARPHSAINTKNLIRSFGWEQIDHPPYSPELSPSDFHLFRYLKEFLGGKRFDTTDEVKEEVQDWLFSQAADVYDLGIQKLVERYDKSLNKYGKDHQAFATVMIRFLDIGGNIAGGIALLFSELRATQIHSMETHHPLMETFILETRVLVTVYNSREQCRLKLIPGPGRRKTMGPLTLEDRNL